MIFRNRDEAGRLLAARLRIVLPPEVLLGAPGGTGAQQPGVGQAGAGPRPADQARTEAGASHAGLGQAGTQNGAIVLALPRGGIPVAAEVARELRLPLDILVVRKLSLPQEPELALGAVASGGTVALNLDLMERLGVSELDLGPVIARQREHVRTLDHALRGNHPRLDVRRRTVLVVDDGLATGATMRAAVAALQKARAERVIGAVPVSAAATCRELARHADQMICLETPEPFYAVGEWYQEFQQVSDEEARRYLAASWRAVAKAG